MPSETTDRPVVHLLCNAHLDPVWLWEWEEGAAAAISTFRTAADLCEEDGAFVFNHNEAILYRWVEEYEPALFRRIQRLVRRGQWHIMGGWYLQPDCNMPSGESFVRQILAGKRYFRDRFGVDVRTAINFDPFGHSRGLVQILQRSGYDAYLFGRPDQGDCPLPADEFVWVGYDGSEVLATRFRGWYNSRLGHAREKVEARLAEEAGRDPVLILWGVGNHGGGPSRKDLRDLRRLIDSRRDVEIRHSTPDDYFRQLASQRSRLPRHRADLNPWAVGCYTSQCRVKRRMRRLECELFATERMALAATLAKLAPYPEDAFAEAERDLLFGQFHDILPGSSIEPVEEAALRAMDHGLEILSSIRARSFFALASGQRKARAGEIPVLVFNPHAWPVVRDVEVEFNLPDFAEPGTLSGVRVLQSGRVLPSQVEQEASNLPVDWRKRVVFRAELAPGQMTRFDCRLEPIDARPEVRLRPRRGRLSFRGKDVEVVINTKTGLIDRYRVRGVEHLRPGAFEPLVLRDDADSWGMLVQSYREVEGRFRLMSPEAGSRFSGVEERVLPSVRVIEEGEVRTVVEALFEWGRSSICQRYKLPAVGTEVEVETRVLWAEKDRMLKLSIPTVASDAEYLGQVAYGVESLPVGGRECVAQRWVAVVDRDGDRTLTCVNDGLYGSDFSEDGLRPTLLRSPPYSSHPWEGRLQLTQDRFVPRIDQGERVSRLWLRGGRTVDRLKAIDREAAQHNERPYALSFFPAGGGERPRPLASLDDDVVLVTAMRPGARASSFIVRLFNPTPERRSTTLFLPAVAKRIPLRLGPFEIRTLRVHRLTGQVVETDLMERAPRARPRSS